MPYGEKPKGTDVQTAVATPESPNRLSEGVRVQIASTPIVPPPTIEHAPGFRGEALTSKEISPELVTEVADYYRLIFGNTMHYAVCPPCEAEGKPARLTAREVFSTGDNFVSTEGMDAAPPCPCPHCQQAMELVYDPETLRDNIDQKLSQSEESFLSILRREGDGSLAGLGFAYITNPLRQLSLEWGSKYPFARPELKDKPEHQRSPERFLACVSDIYDEEIKGNESVVAWNCMTISPDAKGGLGALMRNMFTIMPPSIHDMRLYGDVRRGSQAHGIFKVLGVKDGTTFFEEGSSDILVGTHVGRAAKAFSMSPEEFKAWKRRLTGKGNPE